jgi:ABC-type transporter Mla subunit MlaD
MKVSKWIETSQEIEIDVGADDINAALREAFATPNQKDGQAHDVLRALNTVATFLNAFDTTLIDRLTFGQRLTIEKFLRNAADRFKLPPEVL